MTAVGESDDIANAMIIQPDKKIIVAGTSYVGSHFNFSLVRYTQRGKLDKSFNGNGKVITAAAPFDNKINALALQPDGKIIAAGYSFDGKYSQFTLARYTQNGSTDLSFGLDGIVSFSIGENAEARSILIQSDGKILVSGFSNNGNNNDFAIARLNSDGTLDQQFGENGISITSFGTANSEITSSVLQPDGKIIVAGNSTDHDLSNFALVRYSSNGTIDNSFGHNGIVSGAIGITSSTINSIALQADGKIVVAGSGSTENKNHHFAIARYNADGSLDESFGIQGNTITSVGALDDEVTSIALQPDGKIIAAGYSNNGADYDFAMVRYNANPTPENKLSVSTQNLKIFPDPAINQIQFNLLQQEPNAIWSIYNIYGERLFPANYSLNGNSIVVDIADFPPGVYQVVVGENSDMQKGSFIKQ